MTFVFKFWDQLAKNFLYIWVSSVPDPEMDFRAAAPAHKVTFENFICPPSVLTSVKDFNHNYLSVPPRLVGVCFGELVVLVGDLTLVVDGRCRSSALILIVSNSSMRVEAENNMQILSSCWQHSKLNYELIIRLKCWIYYHIAY